jgi:hypothetical protein
MSEIIGPQIVEIIPLCKSMLSPKVPKFGVLIRETNTAVTVRCRKRDDANKYVLSKRYYRVRRLS